jgi:hypothetical protein
MGISGPGGGGEIETWGRVNADRSYMAGNIEFLETDKSRYEVLPGRGEPYGEITAEFYARLSRGRLHHSQDFSSRTQLTLRRDGIESLRATSVSFLCT